jgi:hypothetical protein
MGARLRLDRDHCDHQWETPQASLIVEAMCTHGLLVIDSSDHFKLSVESSDKWDPGAEEELGDLHLSDFELVEADADRGTRLWKSAIEWATGAFKGRTDWGGGWYEGSFWNALLKSAGSGTDLEHVLHEVNNPDWLATEPG